MKYGKLLVSILVVGSFFGIIFAFTQQVRYPYPAPSPTPMCKTVQDVEWKLIDLTIDKQKAITLAKNSTEFEKGIAGFKINGTEVRESYGYNVFSCSFPEILNVNVGFLLNNDTQSHVLILLEAPSLSKIESVQEAYVGQYDFFKK